MIFIIRDLLGGKSLIAVEAKDEASACTKAKRKLHRSGLEAESFERLRKMAEKCS